MLAAGHLPGGSIVRSGQARKASKAILDDDCAHYCERTRESSLVAYGVLRSCHRIGRSSQVDSSWIESGAKHQFHSVLLCSLSATFGAIRHDHAKEGFADSQLRKSGRLVLRCRGVRHHWIIDRRLNNMGSCTTWD